MSQLRMKHRDKHTAELQFQGNFTSYWDSSWHNKHRTSWSTPGNCVWQKSSSATDDGTSMVRLKLQLFTGHCRTSSNTGHVPGICVVLEKKLGKELLSHNGTGPVFQVCLDVTSSAEFIIFNCFQEYWAVIDRKKFTWYRKGKWDQTVSALV